jgi:hypothetical protein
MLSGDVGGQRTLRPYWRNYFESTDAVVWVVDSGDRLRMSDCRAELKGLLGEEVCSRYLSPNPGSYTQRLAGATLLVFANKQDLSGSMSLEEIRDVRCFKAVIGYRLKLTGCRRSTSHQSFLIGGSLGHVPLILAADWTKAWTGWSKKWPVGCIGTDYRPSQLHSTPQQQKQKQHTCTRSN